MTMFRTRNAALAVRSLASPLGLRTARRLLTAPSNSQHGLSAQTAKTSLAKAEEKIQKTNSTQKTSRLKFFTPPKQTKNKPKAEIPLFERLFKMLKNPKVNFVLGLLTAGGPAAHFLYHEHRKRVDLTIASAKETIKKLNKVYERAVVCSLELEAKFARAKTENKLPVVSQAEKDAFAKIAEARYHIAATADSQLLHPELHTALDRSHRAFQQTINASHNGNIELRKNAIGYYFLFLQLIDGFQNSLSNYVESEGQSYLSHAKNLKILREEQKKYIIIAEMKYKTEILDKSAEDVIFGLPEIFRKRHLNRMEIPKIKEETAPKAKM